MSLSRVMGLRYRLALMTWDKARVKVSLTNKKVTSSAADRAIAACNLMLR
jgi:uncharacterized small protein (DUF1192 family)